MSDTKIEYASKVWNPVTGCTKKSNGCRNCFAEREWPRKAANPNLPKYMGRKFTDVRWHFDTLWMPLHWKAPQVVMVESMGDLFHEKVPFDFISQVFGSMRSAAQHTYLITTKRPEQMLAWYASLPQPVARDKAATFIADYPNVWLGVSVEDQATADQRIPLLLQMPAALHWLSVEPMLGPISLTLFGENSWHDTLQGYGMCDGMNEIGRTARLGWIVCGGESGPHARPMHPDWPRSLLDQCDAAGVPFYFKQWGEWIESTEKTSPIWKHAVMAGSEGHVLEFPFSGSDTKDEQYVRMVRVGKHEAGRLLDGRECLRMPGVAHA